MDKLCDYGCGQLAKYQFKNGKWCCSKNVSQCPNISSDISKKNSGKNHPMYGKKHLENTINKLKGRIAWNKDKTEIYSKETIQLMKNKKFGCKSPMEGKKHSDSSKLKMSNSQIGRKHTEQSKQKIKEYMIKYHPRKGIAHKKTSIEKMRYSSIKKLDYYIFQYSFFSLIEEIREHPETGKIQVHCKNHNCSNSKEQGGWFTPSHTQLYERIRQLEHSEGNGGSYLYCCEECKQECPLFNLYSDPNKENKLNYTSEEYQIFRNEVLKRNNYKCEYCVEPATHVHHSRPQKLEPFFNLDPDFGIACCESCHYKYGHQDECSTGKLANKVCI